jgi:hypothetical protein
LNGHGFWSPAVRVSDAGRNPARVVPHPACGRVKGRTRREPEISQAGEAAVSQMSRPARIANALLILCGMSTDAHAAPARSQHPSVQFVDVSTARGLLGFRNAHGQGAGIAAADFDNDGDVDVYVPQAKGRSDQLYVNSGEGYFTEEAGVHGLARNDESRVALWIDYDNDGDLDLLIANDDELETSSFYLYRQDAGGMFTDVTVAAGIVKPPQFELSPDGGAWWGGLAAGDINNDGFLDFYCAQGSGPAHLFLNNGDGSFSDISESSGVSPEWLERHQPVMYDFNGDGWIDIYVAVDFNPNELWINQGDNTFVDMAYPAGLANLMNDMGVTLGDYDNDGDLDIYVTNIFINGKHNVLFRNDSVQDTLRFVEVSRPMGVDNGRWGWGATFMDMDNDGDVDLAATNGYFTDGWPSDTSKFFWNQEKGTVPFVEEGEIVGFADSFWGSGLIAVDFDLDGDLDLMQACVASNVTTGRLRLLDNQSGFPVDQNNWLVVRPRIDGPNRFAIGAVVRARGGGLEMMRLISAGASYLSQEPAEAFFGAGLATLLDLTIEWPDGVVTTMDGVAVNQVLTITRPAVIAPVVEVVSSEVNGSSVRLRWRIDGMAGVTVTVQRRSPGGAWTARADVTTDALGICDFVDDTVTPGMSYQYRLSFSVQGNPFLLGLVGVAVPPAALSLAGAVPNPSPAGLNVRFSLPSASPATLSLHDLQGRMLIQIDVGPLGPGTHAVDLAAGLVLDPGIYWIRLDQDARILTRKAVLLP